MLCDKIKEDVELYENIKLGYMFSKDFNNEIIDNYNKLYVKASNELESVNLEDIKELYKNSITLIKSNKFLEFISYFLSNYLTLIEMASNKYAKNHNLSDEFIYLKNELNKLNDIKHSFEAINWRFI